MGCGATGEYWNCEREAQVLTSLAASRRPLGVADDQVGGRALSRSLADFFPATLGAGFSGVRLHVDGHAPAVAPTADNSYGKVPGTSRTRAKLGRLKEGLSMLEGSSPMNQSDPAESTWPYFLELYGEPSPEVDLEYAQVLATRGKPNAGPIYEYFWTLGKYEQPPSGRSLRKGSAGTDWGEFSHGSSVQVYMLFPRNSDWRVHELAVSVKYLSPVDEQKTVLQEMGKDIAALQPLLGVAGTAVSAAGAAVGAGAAASATGHVLDAMAKMKVESVPQTKNFQWSVRKVSIPAGKDSPEPADGVVWNLPLSMLESLGSRINGSIAVRIVPLPDHGTPFQSGDARACAVLPLNAKNEPRRVQSKPLRLAPHDPTGSYARPPAGSGG